MVDCLRNIKELLELKKNNFKKIVFVLSAIFALGACSNEENAKVTEKTNVQQIKNEITPFTNRHLEDYIFNVGYQMDEFFVNDYLNLVVNPSELNLFENELDGATEISTKLIKEFVSGAEYLSLDGIKIYFGAIEPLIPIYEDYKGSEYEFGRLELNQEDLKRLNWSNEEQVKAEIGRLLLIY